MEGRVYVVTGGTDGIGKAAVRRLAVEGATVLLHGRDPRKGARLVEELRVLSPNSSIEFFQADFCSLARVRILAEEIAARTSHIDVLINNAGAIFPNRTLSVDGYEMTFAVNHLAPFLLTTLLLGILKDSGHSRIVTTASGAHRKADILALNRQATRQSSAKDFYAMSKLANILFTRALAMRLKGTNVTATCLEPGLVRTNFGRGSGASRAIKNLLKRIPGCARSPEKGAETLVHLATSAEVEGASGGYYFDRELITASATAQDTDVAESLWQWSEQLVRLYADPLNKTCLNNP